MLFLNKNREVKVIQTFSVSDYSRSSQTVERETREGAVGPRWGGRLVCVRGIYFD
jgi:hypothetical protein